MSTVALDPVPRVDSSDFIAVLAKQAAAEIVKHKKEFVDDFATEFFRKAIDGGCVKGPNGQPFKPSQAEMEKLLADYKQSLLNKYLAEEKARLLELSKQKFAEAAKLEASSQIKLAEASKKGQDILTKQFWSIFNGAVALPTERCDEVFSKYLTDRSFTAEETPDGKYFGRINSMAPVLAYLRNQARDHERDNTITLTKVCNFGLFKAEVNDIDTLVGFLKTSEASAIKTIAFNNTISQIAKNKLAEAENARRGTLNPLTVRYLP